MMKVSPFLLKVRPYVLLLLYFVLGALVYSQVALALNPPKTFGGTVVNSDSSVPVDTAVTFKAYIATRTTEQLTQASTGCGYGSGFYQVELGNFTTAWAVGETLVVEFTNSVNSEKKTINVVLDNVNPQLYNVTLQAKVLQSIAVTAPAASFAVGESLQFTATGTYDDASTADLTASATWTVVPTPAGAAAFDGTVKGRLNGLKEGTGTIKASKDGVDSPTVNGTVTAFNGTVTVAANPTSIVANGVTTSAISATVKTSGNVNVVDGVSVAFAVTGGTGAVAPASATTVNGVAASTYTSSTTVGSGTVTATVGAKSGSSTVTLTHGPAAKITLVANPTTISSSAISESTLTATIRDANNNVVTTGAGATLAVTFAVGATTFGDIKTGEATRTAAAGVATSHVVSKVTGGGVIACTASSGALTQGTENVTTAPKVLQSIAIEIIAGGKVSTTSPKVGETVQFKATGTYKDNAGVISTEVITTSVTWNSSVTAKGTVAASGLFSALAVGATNVTAALLGKTSNAIAMSVQAAAAVVIDKTNLPTTIASGGTIDFAAVVSGGTGDGFNYSIEAGSPAGGT
ncbi:MAG: Ig-like domain-containing protein, partial [Proteobacteria bacterium]|nr:Ig-like domain-containing protein [Pseudomonadota bacterium]